MLILVGFIPNLGMKTIGFNPVTKKSKKPLPETAQQALEEARMRRELRENEAKKRPKELSGREGPDPVRFGDWENKGIASDF